MSLHEDYYNISLCGAIKWKEVLKGVKKILIISLIASVLFLPTSLVFSFFKLKTLLYLFEILFAASTISSAASGIILWAIPPNNEINDVESYEKIKEKDKKYYKVKLKNGKTLTLDLEDYKVVETCEKAQEKNNSQIEELNKKIDTLQNEIETLALEQANSSKHASEKNNNSREYDLLNNHNYSINYAIGRDKELKQLEESLIMKSINPLIIGPSGVGKTALVKGLVYKIKKGEVPDFLKDKEIASVDSSSIVSGCKYVGEFEQSLTNLIKIMQKEDKILFIDEFHTLIGLGQGSNSNLDGANILKPYLSNNEIKIIGATTEEEYEKIIKNDSAFTRRFEVIRLDEPKDEVLFDIVNSHIDNYENEYNCKFFNNSLEKEEVINLLIELTNTKHRTYKTDIKNPSLILSILERSFAKAKLENSDIVSNKNVIDSIESNPNIYDSIKEKIINKLKSIKVEEPKQYKKVIEFNKNI